MPASVTRHAAEALAGRLPPLLVAAERVAATVAQGVHGRRRVGTGDSFWQFRAYVPGDAASRIDWRQTAKSERAYVRENEWEAAQSVWLWADRSASMAWRSTPALPTKEERAALLLLAAAALLIRGGERVALLGGMRPAIGRAVLERLAFALQLPAAPRSPGLPPVQKLPRHASLVMIGDLLSPLEEIRSTVVGFASQGVRGHLVQVLDPAEETLPFEGRVRFDGLEHEPSTLVSRVDAIRQQYVERLAEHRAGLAEIARQYGWSVATHRTDHGPHTRAPGALRHPVGRPMLSLGGFAFAAPWVLLGFIVVPALWWLLRVTPPSPTVVRFPAIRLLLGLVPPEETPARTPLWLILMRIVLASLLILALAHPLINPSAALPGSGPLLLAVDDGWAAAKGWTARVHMMSDLIDRAEREGRKVALLTTAADGPAQPLALLRPADARGLVQALKPKPWPVDRATAAKRLDAAPFRGATSYFLSDGLDGDRSATEFTRRLLKFGPTSVATPDPGALAQLLAPGSDEAAALTVEIRRAVGGAGLKLHLRALGADGGSLAEVDGQVPDGRQRGEIALAMPAELRNRVARVELAGEESAGGTLLLDEGSRRRPVGIATDHPAGSQQPLLSDTFYLERALQPFADLKRDPAGSLVDAQLSMILLPNGDAGTPETRGRLAAWVEKGGVLVRFAGEVLASEPADDLLPVTLRQGDRTIGGAMSWEKPAHLAAFPPESPFAGLAIPDDVTVARQVLAEPSVDLPAKTWARLSDGTPLVTGEKRGKGWLVLVHTTSNTGWSNLAISGLFVDMLRRMQQLGLGTAGSGETMLRPFQVMDGFGRLVPAPAGVKPVAASQLGRTVVGPGAPARPLRHRGPAQRAEPGAQRSGPGAAGRAAGRRDPRELCAGAGTGS